MYRFWIEIAIADITIMWSLKLQYFAALLTDPGSDVSTILNVLFYKFTNCMFLADIVVLPRLHPDEDKPRSKRTFFLSNLRIIHTKTAFWGSVNDHFWNQVPEWKDFEMPYTQLRDYWLSASFQIRLRHSFISSLTRMRHTWQRQQQWRRTV